MKRILFLILVFSFLTIPVLSRESDTLEEYKEEFTKPKVIAAGSYLKGELSGDISSEYNNSKDIVKVLVTSDYFLGNTNVIPKNSVIVGHVGEVVKAQQGKNGSFNVDFDYILLPSDRAIAMKGYLCNKSDSKVFGGEFSKRSSYKQTLHRSECFGWKGTLQLRQDGPRVMGQETKLKTGQEVLIKIEKDISF